MRSRDVVDQLIADWRRERPDLDASGMMVVGRIVRLAEHFRRDVETELARSGLSWRRSTCWPRCGAPDHPSG
jgi:hypothetical protein